MNSRRAFIQMGLKLAAANVAVYVVGSVTMTSGSLVAGAKTWVWDGAAENCVDIGGCGPICPAGGIPDPNGLSCFAPGGYCQGKCTGGWPSGGVCRGHNCL